MRPGFSLGNQRGHLMAGLMAALAIMLILSTVVFQAWEDLKRRDDEAEMMFRAKEIVRAIRRYKADHNAVGPASLDELLKPGPQAQYYLRHPYADPLVEDGAWGLLYDGPGGTIIDPGAPDIGADRGIRVSERPSAFGNDPNEGFDLGGSHTGSFTPDGDPVNKHGWRQQGALRIAGVRSRCTDKPFRIFRGFEDYFQWTFTYLDIDIGGTAVAPRPTTGAPGSHGPGRGTGRGGRGGRGSAGRGQTPGGGR